MEIYKSLFTVPTIVLKGLSKKNSLAAERLRRMQRGEDKYFTGSEIGVSHMLGKEPVRGRGRRAVHLLDPLQTAPAHYPSAQGDTEMEVGTWS